MSTDRWGVEVDPLEKLGFETKCSFCDRPESTVQTLIKGPTSTICNECVEMCVSMLDEKAAADANEEGR